jgi:hypothetical protein
MCVIQAGGVKSNRALGLCMGEYTSGSVNAVNSTPPFPMQNHLLAQLPMEERQRWSPHLECVHMPLGEVIYESGATLTHVYFPTTAIVSLLYVMENGASAEIAVVGNEGIVGISLFMGGGSTPAARWCKAPAEDCG